MFVFYALEHTDPYGPNARFNGLKFHAFTKIHRCQTELTPLNPLNQAFLAEVHIN